MTKGIAWLRLGYGFWALAELAKKFGLNFLKTRALAMEFLLKNRLWSSNMDTFYFDRMRQLVRRANKILKTTTNVNLLEISDNKITLVGEFV